jgi:DNA-binding XRE family transcriptional regulator
LNTRRKASYRVGACHLVEEEKTLTKNSLKRIREQRLLSKAELARKAGVSPLTIDRIEKGKNCRMETKRKILLALGYSIENKDQIFGDD